MIKVISIYLMILFLYLNSYTQQGTFGYRISGDGDVVSDVFIIQNGYLLDSVRNKYDNAAYQFEYDENGRLKRDINFYRVQTIILDPRPRVVFLPGSRDYYYNEEGYIDSIGYGHWNDDQWVSDSIGYKYHYSGNGKVISKVYSEKNTVFSVEENTYDFDGKLIKSAEIDYLTRDTLKIIYRKYDSLDRLALRKYLYFGGMNNSVESETHYIYQYDSLNNVNITIASVDSNKTIYNWNYYFEFDEFGKTVYEIISRIYSPEDSTWQDNHEISFNYDENGRILKMGGYWCDYYANGNLDSLVNPHVVDNGYLGASATLIDSYGNKISISQAYYCNFYYSKVVSNIDANIKSKMDFTLYQNYPNPFNPNTKISFEITKSEFVTIDILNTIGQRMKTIANRKFSAGTHTINFDGSGLAAGLYFYKIKAGNFTDIKKMLLIK